MNYLYSLLPNSLLPSWKLDPIQEGGVPMTTDYIGTPLLILFFSIRCPGCLGRAIPYGNRVQLEMGDKIKVIGIHSTFEGSPPAMEELVSAKEKYTIHFPYYLDKSYHTTFHQYKAGGTPHWVLVDEQGRVAYSIFGSEPNNALLRLDYKMEEVISKVGKGTIPKITNELYSAEPERYELRHGDSEGAPLCPYGNHYEWIGYDLLAERYVRFTKSVFKNLIQNSHHINPTEAMLTWNDIIKFANHGNPTPERRVEKSEEEWKSLLTPEQFKITRLKGTERAHSSAMCSLFEPGKYSCVCCGTEMFDSGEKFESGTGWPSFTQPIVPNAIAYHKDVGFGMVRVEITCNTCDAHLGHVFPDGPAPSGLRYCVNAISLEKTG